MIGALKISQIKMQAKQSMDEIEKMDENTQGGIYIQISLKEILKVRNPILK